MLVHAFVFHWPGANQRPDEIERALGPHAPVTVVSADDARRADRPSWVHLGEDAYFTRQWNAALERFRGEVLFHVQADAWHDDFGALVSACRAWMARGAGVWAPDVDWTSHVYDLSRLRRLDGRAYEVPNTDCTCWAVSGDVLAACPRVDERANRYGWGIDYLVAAVAGRLGRPVVRDYSLQVRHPAGTGYDTRSARRELRRLVRGLPRDLAAGVRALMARRDACRSG